MKEAYFICLIPVLHGSSEEKNEARKISARFFFNHGEIRLGQTLVDGIVNRKRVQEELVIEK